MANFNDPNAMNVSRDTSKHITTEPKKMNILQSLILLSIISLTYAPKAKSQGLYDKLKALVFVY